MSGDGEDLARLWKRGEGGVCVTREGWLQGGAAHPTEQLQQAEGLVWGQIAGREPSLCQLWPPRHTTTNQQPHSGNSFFYCQVPIYKEILVFISTLVCSTHEA